ncbi:DUF397 domain-containing protein [Streptomyces sp. NPDC059582]|uniref:DUF397 domain-containing protein n=1 Tax=Streptomyces sp. NPDC059582 TaxID=3346875 RepID=UPI00368EE2BF
MNTPELAWFKSSYSSASGDDCVEVALAWHKSSYSSGSEGDCVEVAVCPATIHIRDSKNSDTGADGPQLAVTPTAWTHFLPHSVK